MLAKDLHPLLDQRGYEVVEIFHNIEDNTAIHVYANISRDILLMYITAQGNATCFRMIDKLETVIPNFPKEYC